MDDTVRAMKALSDATRLRMLNLLTLRECCVCEVMQALEISQTRASRNLNMLMSAGFLKMRKEGLWSLYSVDPEAMRGYLGDVTRAVSQALVGDQTAHEDRERLTKAKRVGPARAEKSSGRDSTCEEAEMKIKILGPGCPKCDELDKRAREVTKQLGVDASIEHVTDIKKIMEYPILLTPGLVIDEKLVFSGRVPTRKEIAQLIDDARAKEPK